MSLLDVINKDYTGKNMPIRLPEYGRGDLILLYKALGFKVGAEIGVLGGRFSNSILRANPDLKLYCIDPWKPYNDLSGDGEEFNKCENDARDRLKDKNAVIIKDLSSNAVNQFKDNSLDFVFIDGAHDFLNVAHDI